MAHTFTLQSGTVVAIDDLVKAATDALADGELTFGEVVQLGGLLAGKVNQFAGLSGLEKQKVVVAAVEKALELTLAEKAKSLPEADREAFEKKVQAAVGFAKDALPAVLTLAVDAANGKLDLGRVKKTCLQTLLLALRCIAKQVPELPLVAVAAGAVESLAKETKADTDPVKTSEVVVEASEKTETKPEESAPSKASE